LEIEGLEDDVEKEFIKLAEERLKNTNVFYEFMSQKPDGELVTLMEEDKLKYIDTYKKIEKFR